MGGGGEFSAHMDQKKALIFLSENGFAIPPRVLGGGCASVNSTHIYSGFLLLSTDCKGFECWSNVVCSYMALPAVPLTVCPSHKVQSSLHAPSTAERPHCRVCAVWCSRTGARQQGHPACYQDCIVPLLFRWFQLLRDLQNCPEQLCMWPAF